MHDSISDQEMRQLKIIDIGRFPPSPELSEKLCWSRDFGLKSIVDGERAFVDTDLGYLILSERLLEDFRAAPRTSPYFSKHDRIYSNWNTSIAREAAKSEKTDSDDWYVQEAGDWPCETGAGVVVAIIDDGIGEELGLLRDPADFLSCLSASYGPNSLNHHGSDCACAIAAKNYRGQRIAPAPDCRIVAAQATRGGANNIWLADLLLMLSWAVFCRHAKIVNMSFSLGAADIESNNGQELLSRIAKQLREQNHALLFAATGFQQIAYPASIDGFVAAGSYEKGENRRHPPMIGDDPSWDKKKELLFAPEKVLTCDGDLFGGTSASCAFTSGVTALYLQRYLDKPHATEARNNTLADVLDIMLKSATLLNPGEKTPARYGIRLP